MTLSVVLVLVSFPAILLGAVLFTNVRWATSPARWCSSPPSPVAIGLASTDWRLTGPALVACGCALAGGLLCLIAVRRGAGFPVGYLLVWFALYAGGVGYAVLAA